MLYKELTFSYVKYRRNSLENFFLLWYLLGLSVSYLIAMVCGISQGTFIKWIPTPI